MHSPPLPRTLLPVRDPYGPDRPVTPVDVELRNRALDVALGRPEDDPAAGAAWERRRRQLLDEARRGR